MRAALRSRQGVRKESIVVVALDALPGARKENAVTVMEKCLEATDDIWDDRDAYIRAVLDVLGIDPEEQWRE